MRKFIRPIVREVLDRTGLIGIFYRANERRLAAGAADPIDDGRPMPPADLMVLVSGAPSQSWFSRRGQIDAARFSALAHAHGKEMSAGLEVLDFGCGCGRIARWLAPTVTDGGGTFHGSDLNPRLVAWCAQSLAGRYSTNRLRPPLKTRADSFDLVYAYSVLTHLREDVAQAWLAELARVIRPGGLALLSFHDETYAQAWGPADLATRLETKPYIVLNDSLQGSNYMSAWSTRTHFSALAAPWFEVVEISPASAESQDHAIAVLRVPHAR